MTGYYNMQILTSQEDIFCNCLKCVYLVVRLRVELPCALDKRQTDFLIWQKMVSQLPLSPSPSLALFLFFPLWNELLGVFISLFDYTSSF